MGARDVEEQLEGALADAITMERALAAVSRTAEARLRSEHASTTDAGYWADVKRIADDAIRGRAPALAEQQQLDAIENLLGDHRQFDEEHWVPVRRIREILDREKGV